MGYIADNLKKIKSEIPADVTLIAVTKTHPVSLIKEAYAANHKIFGENKVQELVSKNTELPSDSEWHLIGHLQSNKVKHIAPFVSLIHSVDSFKLLEEVNKQALKNSRIINCLLQIYIASEETKFGLNFTEAESLLSSTQFTELQNIKIVGLMGMATNTADTTQIQREFKELKNFFDTIQTHHTENCNIKTLSMGMSSDYKIAINEGSNMIRVGSAIFGNRN
ncbi:MAG: YggS family pyridoxal phosphate-dependent enzyme [Bacteroidetes bacterium]|nr:YggS family pyridoxal phosphate-dependent enzyme [Bacteroidota bacterium]